MLRRSMLLVTLATALTTAMLGLAVPSAHAVTTFTRTLAVTGTGAAMYPDFDRATTRYAVTTDATTAGSLTIDATTTDPAGEVLVDGATATGPTTVTGLSSGDEVSVIIDDADGRTPYSVMYLPAGFPKLTVTTRAAGLDPELVALTLNGFEPTPQGGTPLPAFEAIVDRNGVPVYAAATGPQTLDLRQQPDGELTVSRATTAAGHTGTALVTLDDQMQETSRLDVKAPLTNTDGHDAVKLADGSTILLGYEPNSVTGKTDATIQKVDAAGEVTFSWSSSALVGESVASSQAQGVSGDYAHVNSVQSVEDDDLIVSFRDLSAVLRIATVAHDGYQPGDIIWKLGGRDSSFTFVGDALGGPCGQHTANELANGDIMVFDNGTSGLCVNQADPTGPTLNRGSTRVAEYHLDTTAHTATLVWSYDPSATYASFAGSARRLADGDTLIGWADYRGALATEVDAEGTVVWNVTAPAGTGGHKSYATYRAEPITDLTDAITPAVTTTGPADHVTLAQGASVTAGARCTDRGGSNLASCTVTGLVDGKLDTSTTGTKHWTTVAEDGAGNTTTIQRTYTVRPLVSRADALIRTASARTWTGNDVQGLASKQTAATSVRRGHPATGYFLAQNDGEGSEALVLQGKAGTPGFAVRYYANGKDVTGAMVAGKFRTAVLAPGRTQQVRVVVTPRKIRGAAPARTFTLWCWPASNPITFDQVGFKVTARR
ncbi:MAG: aryl-sulfate sulfotransferase [Marmoricola sp.]